MKQTAVEFIIDQLDCLNKERKYKLIDAETYFKNKKALIEQAKEIEKQQQGYSEEEVIEFGKFLTEFNNLDNEIECAIKKLLEQFKNK